MMHDNIIHMLEVEPEHVMGLGQAGPMSIVLNLADNNTRVISRRKKGILY